MSSIPSLRERIDAHRERYDIKLVDKLPTVIVVNGRSFAKTSSLLQKPFSTEFLHCMCGTMIKLCQEIDGAFFGYTFSDEIIIISRNDLFLETQQWCLGRIQKIASLSSSIATLEFAKLAANNNLQLFGDAVFAAETFVLPNFTEAINTIVLKQQQAFFSAVSNACFHELVKNHNIETVRDTISNKNIGQKLDILAEHCQIDFNDYYVPFRQGAACYRAPQIIKSHGQEEIRHKLIIDMELPVFTKDKGFLETIFRGGRDIVRAK